MQGHRLPPVTENRKGLIAFHPCPHCNNINETGYCYAWNTDKGDLLSVCSRGSEPGQEWKSTKASTKDNHVIYKFEVEQAKRQKFPRLTQRREWIYTNTELSPLIRVVRHDHDDTSKPYRYQEFFYENTWTTPKKNPAVTSGDFYQQIALFNYENVQKAIKDGEYIFVVEGEPCVDAMTKLGLVATTNIMGSGKWKPEYSGQLKGAKLVLCPDRDLPGVKHMARIYQDFPDAKFLYAYPDSAFWYRLPESAGLDVANWTEDDKITAEVIIASLEDEMRTTAVVEKRIDENKVYSYDLLRDQVEKIWLEDRKSAKAIAKLKELALISKWSLNELQQLMRSIAEEYEDKELFHNSIHDFKDWMQVRCHNHLDLQEVFPAKLATAMTSRAENLGSHPIRQLQYLLPAITSMVGSKLYVEGKRYNSWKEYLVFYTADVGAPSSGKTPSKNAVFEWIVNLQKAEERRYRQALEDYDGVRIEWAARPVEERRELQNSEENPRIFKRTHCVLKKWIYEKGTVEAILSSLSNQEETKGTVWLRDELAGLFNSLNQYKGGKGDDRSLVLESFNGLLKTSVDCKSEGKSAYLDGQIMSISGGIQLGVLREHMSLDKDPDGLASRFLFANPPQAANFEEWVDKVDECDQTYRHLFTRLSSITVDSDELEGNPIRQAIHLNDEAQAYFIRQYKRLKRLIRRYELKNSALSAYFGKLLSYLLRLSGALHLTDWAFDETGTVNPLICSLSAVKRATLLINYYAYEYISIQQITDDLASSRLEGAMADIWAVVAHEGKISTRDICRRFNRKIEGEKMNAALAIRLINAIAEAGYGRIEGKILLFQEPKELAVNFNTSGETYADSLYDAMDKDLRDLSCNNVTPSHIDHYQEKTDANDVFFDAPGDPIIPRADSDSSDGDDSGGDNGSHPSGGLGKPVNPLPQGGNIAQMAITQVKEEVTSDRVAIPPSRIAKEGFKDAQGNQLEIGDTVKVCSDRWEGEGFHAGESGVIVALVNADEKGYSELNLGRGYIDFGKNRAITILSWQEIELVKKADSVSDF